jgi:hypothetical protein
MSYVTEQKLRDLFYEVEKIRKNQQGGLDLPPKWVLEAATKNMKKDRTWDSFLNVLCIYYDVPPVFARVNKRISAVAHYIEAINLIETKEEIVGMRTILHEFFHHLISKRRSLVPRNTDETLADSYADACMKLLQER